MAESIQFVKRTWVYVSTPAQFQCSPHRCDADGDWSEYEGMLWCSECECDFVPASWGLLDGPVGVNACRLLGISLDRIDLATGARIPFEETLVVR